MKDGGWIPVDKRLVTLLPKDREYSFLEAYISLRIDLENEAEISINGYARMWSWSRNKVRHFVEGLRTGEGHAVDTQRTPKGQEIRLFFKQLEPAKDSRGTAEGQPRDSRGTITINNKEKEEEKAIANLPETVKKTVPKSHKITDEEWLEEIKTNPAYQGIDFDIEIGKAQAWCMTKGRKCSRAFLLNWFNKSEKQIKLFSIPPQTNQKQTFAEIKMNNTKSVMEAFLLQGENNERIGQNTIHSVNGGNVRCISG